MDTHTDHPLLVTTIYKSFSRSMNEIVDIISQSARGVPLVGLHISKVAYSSIVPDE
jgi:hypothetical protein